ARPGAGGGAPHPPGSAGRGRKGRSMNGDRALTILRELKTQQLTADHDELDELLKTGLVVEADPEALELLRRIDALRGEYPEFFHDGTAPRDALQHALEDVEKKLKNDWYRLRTSNASLVEQEDNRVRLRQALGALSDPVMAAAMHKTRTEAALVARGALYVPCPAMGRAVYAATERGRGVRRELGVRIARFTDQPLSAFLKAHNKVEAKMQAFSAEVSA